VFKIDGETGDILASFSSPALRSAAGIAFGPDGFLYVAGAFTDDVVRFDPRDGSSRAFTHGASVKFPHGVAFGPDGNLYVTSGLTGQVLRYSSATGEFYGGIYR
jgi:DNA-binding beta-propeller fold protein YncE